MNSAGLDRRRRTVEQKTETKKKRYEQQREYDRVRRATGPRRESDAYKESRRKHQFVGIDGEGENVSDADDSDHIYTMLCSSRGDHISNPEGLVFEQCADFLIELAAKYPLANIVGYSLNYDIQMMVKGGLTHDELRELWTTHRVKHGRYLVEWIPSKFCRIVRGGRRANHTTHKRSTASVTVWDTFGFFQMSFYNTIREWEVTTPDIADRILGMKLQRGNFKQVSNDDIMAYCFEECRLLEQLMDKLQAAFQTAKIPLRRYDGAGAAAAALMSANHVQRHIGERKQEDESLALRAYFGGRVELFRVGEFDSVYTWDINSAYPYALTLLCSLDGAEWRRSVYRYGVPYAIWEVEWNLPSDEPLAPFPHRNSTGAIRYVRSGRGWYHSVEVDAAVRLYGSAVVPLSGYVLEPRDDARPFAFLETLYEERRRRKSIGDVSQLPMKLSMNGISGKLAQGMGYGGKRPRYQCFYWAGRVTAQCRAQILESAYPVRHSLVGIATDGVFSLKPNENLPYSKRLGEYERGVYANFLSVQAGVYCAFKLNGEYTNGPCWPEFHGRNRGFTTREINWSDVRERYRKVGVGARSVYKPTRFVSLGASLPDFNDFGTWRARERKLSITIGHKTAYEANNPQTFEEDAITNRRHPQYGVLYPGVAEAYESTAYRPKIDGWMDIPQEELDAILGELEEW